MAVFANPNKESTAGRRLPAGPVHALPGGRVPRRLQVRCFNRHGVCLFWFVAMTEHWLLPGLKLRSQVRALWATHGRRQLVTKCCELFCYRWRQVAPALSCDLNKPHALPQAGQRHQLEVPGLSRIEELRCGQPRVRHHEHPKAPLSGESTTRMPESAEIHTKFMVLPCGLCVACVLGCRFLMAAIVLGFLAIIFD